MTISKKIEIPFTDAPPYLTKLVFKRHGNQVYIKVRKRNTVDQAEAELPVEEFFKAIDMLRE